MNKILVSIVLIFGACVFGMEKIVEKPGFYSLYAPGGEFLTFANEVEKAGFKWVRFHGDILGTASEKGIIEAAKRGITVVPVIRDTFKTYDSKNLPVWRERVRELVNRYCEGCSLWKENPSVKPLPVKYIEIWNEPNIEFLKPPEGKKRDECYIELLKSACEEIKKLKPEVQVIGMNTSGGTLKADGGVPPNGEYKGLFGWLKFMKSVHKYEGGKYYDIAGIHPYIGKMPPEKAGYIKALEVIREECKTNAGGEKPIWVTEVGYSLPVKLGEQSLEGQVKDEEEQANWMTRFLAISAANGIGQFQIMYVSDIDNFKAGLFDRSKKWRKQAYAIKNMIEVLPEPVLIRKLSEGTDNIYAYVFKGTGAKEVIMSWTTGKEAIEKEFEVKETALTLVTRDGEKSSIKTDGGKVKVTLSQSPVYIY